MIFSDKAPSNIHYFVQGDEHNYQQCVYVCFNRKPWKQEKQSSFHVHGHIKEDIKISAVYRKQRRN